MTKTSCLATSIVHVKGKSCDKDHCLVMGIVHVNVKSCDKDHYLVMNNVYKIRRMNVFSYELTCGHSRICENNVITQKWMFSSY